MLEIYYMKTHSKTTVKRHLFTMQNTSALSYSLEGGQNANFLQKDFTSKVKGKVTWHRLDMSVGNCCRGLI